eukprot:CAMPEP_0196677556 /NCGR_PEP_ID=MMETSP1090-20130531/5732_1 /TAXON_ID=37098 /ORGANISM="Isochrysis sp, Strain CCMP1244" /LENGTH=233 /DNA_ID=CAMNT_0042015647 /DNA_START=154 /DNA_END=852 /DNA_ORIENTATION=-
MRGSAHGEGGGHAPSSLGRMQARALGLSAIFAASVAGALAVARARAATRAVARLGYHGGEVAAKFVSRALVALPTVAAVAVPAAIAAATIAAVAAVAVAVPAISIAIAASVAAAVASAIPVAAIPVAATATVASSSAAAPRLWRVAAVTVRLGGKDVRIALRAGPVARSDVGAPSAVPAAAVPAAAATLAARLWRLAAEAGHLGGKYIGVAARAGPVARAHGALRAAAAAAAA